MGVISCGTIIRNDYIMLVVRGTGNTTWNLPKGIIDDGESHWDAAERETFEETGIDLTLPRIMCLYEKKHLGVLKYYSGKDLSLYDINFKKNDLPEIEEMGCISGFYHEKWKKWVDEIAEYKYIPIMEYTNYFNKSLIKVFDRLVKYDVFSKK